MDITEKKPLMVLDDRLKQLMKRLRFKNAPIELKGSASLSSQRYYSDYDLFSGVLNGYTAEQAYEEIGRIMSYVLGHSDLYFIELKEQTQDGRKIRWKPGDSFDFEKFKKGWEKVEFIKLDIILFVKNRFIEVSVIYQFSRTPMTTADYVRGIKEDIKELEAEGDYYKILKRHFSIARAEGDKATLLHLSKFLNSPIGEEYQKGSNLEAIQQVQEFYDDPLTKKRIQVNLGDLKNEKDAGKVMEKVNREAQEFLERR